MYRNWLLICALSFASLGAEVWAQSRRPPTEAPVKRGTRKKPARGKQSSKGVRSMFAAAQKLYNERKYDEALIAYDRILRKYPGHQPTFIQMAKVFYRLDRVPEAYRLFTRVNPVGLDIETSYEYALSHFWMRQYQQAMYGFQRIPQGHSLYDLANYYGGISALKLKRLIEAETMMEKAVVLPSKLSQSRKNYLRHIQELKLLYEKKGLAEERALERKRIEAQINAEKPVKLAPKDHPNIKQETEYKHGGFEEVETAPEIGVLLKNQLVDYHGYAEEEAKLRIAYFQFKGGPLVPLPIRVGGDQAAIGLQLILRAEEQEREGVERRNIQTDDIEDIQRILTSDPEKTNTKFGTITLQPWIEIPTTLNVWLALGGKLFLRYPDFERANYSSSRAGYVRIGSKVPGRDFSAKYQYAEIANSDSERIQGINTWQLLWNFEFTKTFGLELELLHDFFEYDDNTIDGPSSATSLSANVFNDLPFNFTLGIKGSGQYQSQNVLHDLPTYGDVDADGQVYTGKLYLEAEPVTWFGLSVSTVVQKSNWQVEPVEAQDTYEKNNPDFQQDIVAEATLNLLF